MQFRTLRLRRDPSCPVCGDQPTVTSLIDYQQFCGVSPNAPPAPSVPEISVEALKTAVDAGANLWILDVREPREWEICRIPGSTLIPLGELPKRLAEIPHGPGAPEIVVHCKMGGRSAKAVRLLQEFRWRVREVRPGPDGALYLGVDDGLLVRLRPATNP